MISFKPKQVTKAILSVLPERTQDVLKKRFGLDDSAKRMTLEAIGGEYHITRERVRQIENAALEAIRSDASFATHAPVFTELERHLMEHAGGVAHEETFLCDMIEDRVAHNHLNFLMVLAPRFNYHKEDEDFRERWSVDPAQTRRVETALRQIVASLTPDDLVAEPELIARLLKLLKDTVPSANEDVARHWLILSKQLGKNPLGEWGKASSPNIHVRGIRDFAFLVLREKKEPMHFTDVAAHIKSRFGRHAHVATCHNELIKDDRFVLTGRGLYGLSDWGYTCGTVRDVIRSIIERDGALTRDEIMSRVLKERRVKENTIAVNLHNSRFFRRDAEGRYTPV